MFKQILSQLTMLGASLLIGVLLPINGAVAEDFQGTTIESRIVLGFMANDAALGAWLPDGWKPMTLTKGPLAGSNLIMAMMDQHLIRDAEGKSETPDTNRAVAFFVYGIKQGEQDVRGFVIRVYEPAPIIDPYGNSVAADIERSARTRSAAAGSYNQEAWTIRPAKGGAIALELAYENVKLAWSEGGQSLPYSASNPEFHRIYRYDQLAGLAMNTSIGKKLSGEVSFSSTVSELAALFDGAEEPVAVVAIPVYVRGIYLP
jgi:hypothetical protein